MSNRHHSVASITCILYIEKQSPRLRIRGVENIKRYYATLHEIYRRSPVQKCYFNNTAM